MQRPLPIRNRGRAAALLIAVQILVVVAFCPAQPPSGYGCGPGWLSADTTVNVFLKCADSIITVRVFYCYPIPEGPGDTMGVQVYPKTQFIITAIGDLPDSCILDSAEMRTIGLKMLELNPQNFPCGPTCNSWCDQHPFCTCPTLYPEWRFSYRSCFKSYRYYDPNDTSVHWDVFVNCNVDGLCSELYDVCCSNGSPKFYFVGSVSTEECTKHGLPIYGCNPVCPNGPPVIPGPGDTCDVPGLGSILEDQPENRARAERLRSADPSSKDRQETPEALPIALPEGAEARHERR